MGIWHYFTEAEQEVLRGGAAFEVAKKSIDALKLQRVASVAFADMFRVYKAAVAETSTLNIGKIHTRTEVGKGSLHIPLKKSWYGYATFEAKDPSADITALAIADIELVTISVLPNLDHQPTPAEQSLSQAMHAMDIIPEYVIWHNGIDETLESNPDIWVQSINYSEDPLVLAELIDQMHAAMPGNTHLAYHPRG